MKKWLCITGDLTDMRADWEQLSPRTLPRMEEDARESA